MCTQRQTRDSIEDVWGPRTPFRHEWPTRVDVNVMDEPDRWVQSACILCSNGCGLDIGVKDGKVVGVRGRATDRVNKGRLGPKGLNGWTAMNATDRLTHPMVRKNGELERASWDEAMDLIVEKTKAIRERLTAHGIAFYTSGQLMLEEYYALALIGKAGLNTLHMDGNTRLCTATAAASMRESFGSDGQPGSYTDIDYTDCIFMVGHNMAATQTVLWARILDRLAGPNPPELIVVDSRRSESARKATLHLMPKVGTNMALLNGIQHLLFKHDWIDYDYLQAHVVGMDALRETVDSYHPDYVAEVTGVPASDIEEAARIIGTAASILSTALQGVYQSNQATASACQINNINLLRGMVGRPGCGILQMNGQPTAQNNREAGCDGEYPGFRNFSNPDHMAELADIWNIPLERLPHWSEPTHVENILKHIENDSIQMLWISGTNPVVSLPNIERARRLMTKPELFVVCQDIFLTETAALADVVLPAAQWGEKTGCFTNVDRTVHLAQKAVDAPGEARSDLDIFVDFSRRMGFRDRDGNPILTTADPETIFERWKAVSKGRPCDYSGLTYEKLTGGSGIQWPCNDENPFGKQRLFEDGIFFTDIDYCESFGHDLETGVPYTREEYEAMNPAGRAILKTAHYQPPPEEPDDQYPLRLSTGRNVYHFHTRTKTGRSRRLQEACPEPTVRISDEDAAALNVSDGEEVVVRSRRGAVQMKAAVGRIAPGQIFIPFHFGYWDAKDDRARAANELTIDRWDPISKQPAFKSGAVRIEKPNGVVQEQQSAARARARQAKSNATDIDDASPRERHLEHWLGETYHALQSLEKMYQHLIPKLVKDTEIIGGLQVIQRITRESIQLIEPFAHKYNAASMRGKGSFQAIHEAVFPAEGTTNPYETLIALKGLYLCLADLEVHFIALNPASQALWDSEFQSAVLAAKKKVDRMQAWTKHHMHTRSSQTLLVPAKTSSSDLLS